MIKVIRYCERCGNVADEKCYYGNTLCRTLIEDGKKPFTAILCSDCQKSLDDMKNRQAEELRKFWEESEDGE